VVPSSIHLSLKTQTHTQTTFVAQLFPIYFGHFCGCPTGLSLTQFATTGDFLKLKKRHVQALNEGQKGVIPSLMCVFISLEN